MKSKILSTLVQALLAVVAFLLPVFFFPFLADSYDLGKQVFFLAAIFVAFVLWVGQSLIDKRLVYKKSRYLLPTLALLAAFLASTLINSPNKTQSFLGATGTGAILIAFLAYLFLNSLAKRKLILYGLLGGSAFLSLLRLGLFLANFAEPVIFPSLNLNLTGIWSPTGSLLAQTLLALAVVPLGFGLMYESLKQQKLASAGSLFLVNLLNLIGLGLGLHLLITVAKPILLPQGTAWAIALEGLKNSRFAALGLGPNQFVNAFTLFKPLSFNVTDLWNLRFGSSSNWYFQLLTEVGIVGLLAYLFLAWHIIKDAIKVFRQPRVSYLGLAVYLSLVILLIAQSFIPLNFFLLILFFILLAVARDEEPQAIDFAAAGNFVLVGLAFPFIFWGVIFFLTSKLALANYHFLNSLKAASRNDGVKTYNDQIKAITNDPSSAAYRIAYSQTNFALANALASKKDLTEQDRSTISQLIQQAIREAKAAVALDNRSTSAWENLASLYRNLLNFAEGADQWALASYQQAISLDPLNPGLRVELGGLLYGQQEWTEAALVFAQAANLKQDWANAHYNLANALRESGDLQGAKREYETTQTLVKIDSNDYLKVTQELEELKKRLPTPTPSKKIAVPETLVTPAPAAEGIEPPLELPEEGPTVAP
jgi:tetratricopeptide (TPR) repeat protein